MALCFYGLSFSGGVRRRQICVLIVTGATVFILVVMHFFSESRFVQYIVKTPPSKFIDSSNWTFFGGNEPSEWTFPYTSTSTPQGYTDENTRKPTERQFLLSMEKSANDLIRLRFEKRTDVKWKTCKLKSYAGMNGRVDLSNRMTKLAQGSISWCRIPKVGSTYLISLNQKVLKKQANNTEPRDSRPKTLLLVREPYSRLMSGYIGKIVTNPPWARGLGVDIIKRFRPNATPTNLKCGHDVTFPEFLKYFIEADLTGWKRDLHFTPMHKQCNPCNRSYDFIGHLETLKDDLTFVLQSVNITVEMDLSDEEMTLRNKAKTFIGFKKKILQCESMCSALSKVWWSYHARGLISTDIGFPLSDSECESINGTAFADKAWDAHLQSIGRIDKTKQRREAMVRLYLQASLTDRMAVRAHLQKDCELYGYDPQPSEIFPEIYGD